MVITDESWGRGITPNEEAWVGELIDAELAKRDAEIERLHVELHSADRIANDWTKQNVELRRLLRFFFENVPVQYHENYAEVMKQADEILSREDLTIA